MVQLEKNTYMYFFNKKTTKLISNKLTVSISFVIGSIFFTYAGFEQYLHVQDYIESFYILGSIFYTLASYIQLKSGRDKKKKS